MSTHYFFPTTGGSGASCGSCQAWVPWGTKHVCSPPPIPASTGELLIANALNRLAAAVEELIARRAA